MGFKYSSILLWSYILLSLIIFCNLNGVIFLSFGVNAPLSPIILILCFIILYVGVFKNGVKLNSNILILLLLFYVLYLFIGVCTYIFDPSFKHPRTSNLDLIRSYLSSTLIISSFYIGAKSLLKKAQSNLLFKLLLGFTFFSALFVAIAPLIGLSSIYTYASSVTTNPDRQTGFFGNPNEAGFFSVYFLVIVLSAYSFFKKKHWFILLLIPLAIYDAFFSFSRASMVLAVFILVFYIVFNLRFVNKLRLSNSRKPILFGVVFLIGTFIVFQQFFSYVQSLSHGQKSRLLQTFQLFSGEINDQTTSHRSDLFTYAWTQIKKRPITGYGLGVFHRIKDLPTANKMGVHNTQLMIFAESGIIPIFLFCLVFLWLGIKGWVHPSPGLGFLIIGICIVYFINVAGVSHNGLENRTSNALIGIAIALSQIKKYNP